MGLPIDNYVKNQLDDLLEQIETPFNANGISIISPIFSGLDQQVRTVIESNHKDKKDSLVIIHDTLGGYVEVVERIVECIRNFYKEVIFIIPNVAMSAGTIFTLSGDRILMDYFSRLGPIDPQIERNGTFVPASSYLDEYDRLNKKSLEEKLTPLEYVLIGKFDLGELYEFQQAKKLSEELLVKWLTNYKFKDWEKTETKNTQVTNEFKEERAREITNKLNDTKRWHSHGRGIDKHTLINEIGLKIEDYNEIDKGLAENVHKYFDLLMDYMMEKKMGYFIHSRWYFPI